MRLRIPLLGAALCLLACPASVRPESIHDGVRSRDLNWVRRALAESPACLESTDDPIRATPLQLAAHNSHDRALANYLLSKGAILDIFSAAALGNIERVRALLRKNPKLVTAIGPYGSTPLHFAVGANEQAVAVLLLDHKADVNARCDGDHDGSTPLMIAVARNNLAMAKMLLARGADVHMKDTGLGNTLLHDAALNRSRALLELFLARKLEVNARNNAKETPLHYASFAGRKDLAEVLLAHKALLDPVDEEGRTPLQVAADGGIGLEVVIKKGQLEVAEFLCSKGARVDFLTALNLGHTKQVAAFLKAKPSLATEAQRGVIPLCRAAARGHTGVAELLLKYKADPNPEWHNNTALHYATAYGHVEVVKILLAHKAKVDARNRHGRTPLYQAAEVGCDKVARLLLDHKADPVARDEHGETPLRPAAQGGHTAVVALLLARKEVLKAKTPSGERCIDEGLRFAALNRHTAVVRLLLAHGADLRARETRTGASAIHWAAAGGSKDVLAMLLAKGADVNDLTREGVTPLLRAAANGRTEAVRFLLAHKASPSALATGAWAPLHSAAELGYLDIVKLLLDHKAPAGVTTTEGKTPLDLAVAAGQDEVAEILRRHIRKK